MSFENEAVQRTSERTAKDDTISCSGFLCFFDLSIVEVVTLGGSIQLLGHQYYLNLDNHHGI